MGVKFDGAHDLGMEERWDGCRFKGSIRETEKWIAGGVRNIMGAVSGYRGYRLRPKLLASGDWGKRATFSRRCQDGRRCTLGPATGIDPSVKDRTDVTSSDSAASDRSSSDKFCSLLLEEERVDDAALLSFSLASVDDVASSRLLPSWLSNKG